MRNQRGALTFVTPLLMVLVVILGTLAVDGARLYSLRQEMQSQVNVAAMAAADAAQACGGETISLATIQQRALGAATTQGYVASKGTLSVQPGVIESDGEKVLSFQPVSDLRKSNGVVVEQKREVPISVLLPESTFGTVKITAEAAARKELVATLSGAGSTAVLGGDAQTANLLNVILGEVLNGGTPFSIDPTDFQSLALTTARLGDVLDSLGVDSLEAMLSTDVLVADLLQALDDNDGLNDVGGALDQLIGAAGVQTIKIADIIEVVGTTKVPENSRLPVYDTVIALVLNLAEGQLLEGALTDTQINIPNVTSTRVSLFVGKAPTVVTGPARQDDAGDWITRLHAPDLGLTLTSELNVLGLLTLELPLAVEAGGGDAELVWADCAEGTNTNSVALGLDVAGQAARVATGEIDASGNLNSGPVSLAVLENTLPGRVGLATITANLDLTLGGGTERVELGYTLNEDNPSSVFTQGGLSEADLDQFDINVQLFDNKAACGGLISCLLVGIGDLVSGIVDGVTSLLGLEEVIASTVEGLVNALGTTLIDPLLNALGVSVGTMQVAVTGADQNSVQLLEYCGVDGC
ncbi:hypothetical protein ACLD02_00340 [Alloalcanivorax sp. C16-2]|uniref:hypothetical protein n=1 Tax=Alloalcanivorax sp. C16-2 TaxID=3390052 RepID=UPI0039704E70